MTGKSYSEAKREFLDTTKPPRGGSGIQHRKQEIHVNINAPDGISPEKVAQEVKRHLMIEREPSTSPLYSYPPMDGRYISVSSDIYANKVKYFALPEYGEVRIVTHAGKVTFVETTVKEKVE